MNFKKSVFLSNLVILALGFLIVMFSSAAQATTLYVTTPLDNLTANGRCSLREAIISANTDTNYNSDCVAAGSGADTIVLRSRGYCLSLTNAVEGEDEDDAATGDLDILQDLTIQGDGQELTSVDAGAGDSTDLCATLGDRVFDIASGTTVSLSGMTIKGGSGVTHGGGVYVSDSASSSNPVLNLQEVTISDNAISGSSGNGGGLYGYSSTITLTDSTVTNNNITAENTGHGSGIYASFSTLTLTDSTVSDNIIESGIWAYGAGIYGYSSRSTITLINSTISGNRAEGTSYAYGGGVYQSSGTVHLLGSTMSGNQAAGPSRVQGGGIYLSTSGSSGSINSKNSILSGNDVSGSSSADGADCYGSLNSYGYNFIATVTTSDNCTVTEMANAGTDITTRTHAEISLGMLTDNGGDSETIALSSSSPAIDVGNCESFFDLNDDGVVDTTSDILTADQRGQSRTSPCDIGAYEYISTATCGDGAKTGSEACDDGNTTAGDGCSDACVSETDADSDGYSPYSNDCDDSDANIYFGATESCNDTDDDCDGITDEGCSTYYVDADGDSYGDASISTSAMSLPTGYASNARDCNDASSSINPSADDTCDGIDTNCDGAIDEEDDDNTTILYEDADGDSYGNLSSAWNACSAPSTYVSDSSDCDDTSATIHPGMTEDCTDGIDQDCDFVPDETTYYADADGDGYGDGTITTSTCSQPSGYVTSSTDCDDTNPIVNPVATETCEDGTDQDCDGTDAACAVTEVPAPTSETDCTNGADDDADGVSDCSDSDCDASCQTEATWYADSDADGYGNASVTQLATSQPSGYVTDSTDCNDSLATAYPGAAETCGDSTDQDCDGSDVACSGGGGGSVTTDPETDCDNGADDDSDSTFDCDDSDCSSDVACLYDPSITAPSGGGCAIGGAQEAIHSFEFLLPLFFGFAALALPRFGKE